MAADTPNLGLKRPDLADYFHLANHLNGNWNILDAFAGAFVGIIVMWSGLLENIPDGWALCDGSDSTPDLREKFILGWSNGVDPGGTGGSNQITPASHTHGIGTIVAANESAHTHGDGSLTTNNIGAHTHTVNSHTHSGGDLKFSRGGTYDGVPAGDVGTDHVEVVGNGWNGRFLPYYWTGATGGATPGTNSQGNHTHTVTGTTAAGSAHTHTISGSTAGGASNAFDNRPAFYKLAFIIKT